MRLVLADNTAERDIDLLERGSLSSLDRGGREKFKVKMVPSLSLAGTETVSFEDS